MNKKEEQTLRKQCSDEIAKATNDPALGVLRRDLKDETA